MVAGTAPSSRTAASLKRAVSTFCGRGSPWAMTVDSNATTGSPAASAAATSSLTVSNFSTYTLQRFQGSYHKIALPAKSLRNAAGPSGMLK